jgi:hypothetical protein
LAYSEYKKSELKLQDYMWNTGNKNDIDVNTMKIGRNTRKKITWYPRSQTSVDLAVLASSSEKNWGTFFALCKSDPRLGILQKSNCAYGK